MRWVSKFQYTAGTKKLSSLWYHKQIPLEITVEVFAGQDQNINSGKNRSGALLLNIEPFVIYI